MERDCDLTKVGGELDSKSYGIGMRKRFLKCQGQRIFRVNPLGLIPVKN